MSMWRHDQNIATWKNVRGLGRDSKGYNINIDIFLYSQVLFLPKFYFYLIKSDASVDLNFLELYYFVIR